MRIWRERMIEENVGVFFYKHWLSTESHCFFANQTDAAHRAGMGWGVPSTCMPPQTHITHHENSLVVYIAGVSCCTYLLRNAIQTAQRVSNSSKTTQMLTFRLPGGDPWNKSRKLYNYSPFQHSVSKKRRSLRKHGCFLCSHCPVCGM